MAKKKAAPKKAAPVKGNDNDGQTTIVKGKTRFMTSSRGGQEAAPKAKKKSGTVVNNS